MNIKCPQCDTLYDVSIEIANSGAQVQCAKCNDIFTATPTPEPEQVSEQEPEQSEPAEIVLDPITPEPEPEPTPEEEQPSELLSAEEKEFFSSFGEKIAKEDAASAEQQVIDDASDPSTQEINEDDIGWVEDEPDPQPEESPKDIEDVEADAVVDPMQELEPAEEIDLFGDNDLSNEPDPIVEPSDVGQPNLEMDELLDEPTPEAIVEPSNSALNARVLIGWGALAASVLFVVAGATLFRVPIVKALPGMAGLYDKVGLPVNVRGLEFAGLNHQWMNKNGRAKLIVRGEILNITDEPMPVPQILFSMIDKSGLEFFQWTERAGPTTLQPKARARFRASIPAPADRVRQLKIRFANR